jgi:preprotein translocase subunit SecA
MNWVMDKALPDDVPIEAAMVTKAIERAQNTVEQRNAETRKNVLKYDEVMNEQRKVIYRRRDQILDGADLRDEAQQYLREAVEGAVGTYCVSDFSEEWDLEGLTTEVASLWPGETSVVSLQSADTLEGLEDLLFGQALELYEQREAELGEEVLRQVERQVMLRIIDQKWREHLREMDLLREGIHLRAMGQKDPATEWQREGFEMFGLMMTSIALDFVKYIMHVQIAVQRPEEDEQNIVGLSADKSDASPGTPVRAIPEASASAPVKADEPAVRAPIVKTELEKVGRNEPCPCGSGRKFKQCHGRPGEAR